MMACRSPVARTARRSGPHSAGIVWRVFPAHGRLLPVTSVLGWGIAKTEPAGEILPRTDGKREERLWLWALGTHPLWGKGEVSRCIIARSSPRRRPYRCPCLSGACPSCTRAQGTHHTHSCWTVEGCLHFFKLSFNLGRQPLGRPKRAQTVPMGPAQAIALGMTACTGL